MADRDIELPESLYKALLAKAEAHGQTPAEWIASKVNEPKFDIPPEVANKPLWELLKERVGTCSFEVPHDLHQRTGEIFTEILMEKYQRKVSRRQEENENE